MTEKEFVIWLHGYLEIENPKSINEKQTQVIKDHLDTFFKKVTPDRSSTVSDKHTTSIVVDEGTDATSKKGYNCKGCGRWLGEGFVCTCMFSKSIPLTQSAYKCFYVEKFILDYLVLIYR